MIICAIRLGKQVFLRSCLVGDDLQELHLDLGLSGACRSELLVLDELTLQLLQLQAHAEQQVIVC